MYNSWCTIKRLYFKEMNFDKMYNKKIFLKDIISIITVSFLAILMALSYQLFVVENNFAPEGLNGIATMIQYKTGFSIGYMSLLINVPLCILGFFF